MKKRITISLLLFATISVFASQVRSRVASANIDELFYEDLPYDAEVKYLESTGTQYINTGVSGDAVYGLEFDFQFLQNSNGFKTQDNKSTLLG